MAKNHGARQQKRAAKQKAKRLAKRSILMRRDSKDPNIRLQGAEKWPIVQTLVGAQIWSEGIGHMTILREGPDGQLIFAAFLVDVYCLGVKDAFWRADTRQEYENVIQKMSEVQEMRPINPACLAKIIAGAVEYAQSLGFQPHPDYRHASMLLAGIDPSACRERFAFGRDGKPLYIQGPNESLAQARAIMERVHSMGGHYVLMMPGSSRHEVRSIEDDFDDFDSGDEEDAE
jgi:hypothetical protein